MRSDASTAVSLAVKLRGASSRSRVVDHHMTDADSDCLDYP